MLTPPLVPPPPDDRSGRTAFLRVLAATALTPVLFVVAWNLPLYTQDTFIKMGIWLALLVPAGAVLMSVVSFVRGDRPAGGGYLIGALVAAVVGFGSCAVAVLASL